MPPVALLVDHPLQLMYKTSLESMTSGLHSILMVVYVIDLCFLFLNFLSFYFFFIF